MNPQNPRHPTLNYNEYGAQMHSPAISLHLHHTVWLLGPESKNPPFFFPSSLMVVAEVSCSQNTNNKGQSSHGIDSAPGNVGRAHHK